MSAKQCSPRRGSRKWTSTYLAWQIYDYKYRTHRSITSEPAIAYREDSNFQQNTDDDEIVFEIPKQMHRQNSKTSSANKRRAIIMATGGSDLLRNNERRTCHRGMLAQRALGWSQARRPKARPNETDPGKPRSITVTILTYKDATCTRTRHTKYSPLFRKWRWTTMCECCVWGHE